MNLVVGVLCGDGIVVGAAASGAARAGARDAAEAPPANTFVLRDDLILAGSGRVGLGQRFADVVGAIRSDSRFQEWTALGITKTICAEVVDDFASTRCDRGQFGALLAFAACDGFQLCEFSAGDLQPELKTPDRWFASMGAGKPIADPFLAFLQRAFFASSPPGLAEGVFAATWALDYTVGLGSGAGARSEQIAVLAEEGPDLPLTARLLTKIEIADCLAEVRAAEKHLASFRRASDSSHE
ncbi:MAG TPA: hypothetical protein VMY37_12640 [Thermoguttaceae bacterium]|nr:hypothetical protein [Thermoguttaceae bacterium]